MQRRVARRTARIKDASVRLGSHNCLCTNSAGLPVRRPFHKYFLCPEWKTRHPG